MSNFPSGMTSHDWDHVCGRGMTDEREPDPFACDCGHGDDRYYELDDVTGRTPCIENGCPCLNYGRSSLPSPVRGEK